MNPFDMVVTDWGMTLAPFPGMELGARTMEVLTKLSRRGGHVVLASGRPAGASLTWLSSMVWTSAPSI